MACLMKSNIDVEVESSKRNKVLYGVFDKSDFDVEIESSNINKVLYGVFDEIDFDVEVEPSKRRIRDVVIKKRD